MTNTTGNYPLPYPESTDPVNVHGDIKNLASEVSQVLSSLDLSVIQVNVINTSGESLPAGTPVYATGYTTATTVGKSLSSTTGPILGLLKQPLENGSSGIAVVAGVLGNVNTSGFATGDVLYVAESGGLTNSRPVGGSGAVGVVSYSNSNGTIIVEAKGNGTWGALRDGLA
jgi:hypothetical protein